MGIKRRTVKNIAGRLHVQNGMSGLVELREAIVSQMARLDRENSTVGNLNVFSQVLLQKNAKIEHAF